jgi:transcription elongation factor GreA-like protein
MFLDYVPGDFVANPNNKGWGIGQIQSIINNKITVNFENISIQDMAVMFSKFTVIGNLPFSFFETSI